jgi:HK97 family phage prohead protease
MAMTNKDMERRALMPFELRADEEKTRVIGHAAVFNQEADIGGMFREVIRPGAFTRAIQESDVPFLIEHSDLPLARNRSGTLKLSEDQTGLRIETELDGSDPDVQRIIPKMKRGDLDKMSFAFRATRQEWVDGEDDEPDLRILHEVELFDVSIVTNPAFDGTDIALRTRDAKRDEARAAYEEKEAKRKAAVFRKTKKRLTGIADVAQRKSALSVAKQRLDA